MNYKLRECKINLYQITYHIADLYVSCLLLQPRPMQIGRKWENSLGENGAPQPKIPVNGKSCEGKKEKTVNFEKRKAPALVKGMLWRTPQDTLSHVTTMVFLCMFWTLVALIPPSRFEGHRGGLHVWEHVWYYLCCKPQSFPGLFSDVLQTWHSDTSRVTCPGSRVVLGLSSREVQVCWAPAEAP